MANKTGGGGPGTGLLREYPRKDMKTGDGGPGEVMELRRAIKAAMEIRGTRAYTRWFADWCRDEKVDTRTVALRKVIDAIRTWLEQA